jgi:uncharacterized protein DUF6504
MGMFSESVDVACGPEGQPVELQWGGRRYTVCAEPVHWYERRQWWAEEQRAPLGSGPGLVDHEIWRVQVAPVEPPLSEEAPAAPEHLTLDLVRHTGSGRWRLLRIHDALRHKTA